jgi:hypothetical protein
MKLEAGNRESGKIKSNIEDLTRFSLGNNSDLDHFHIENKINICLEMIRAYISFAIWPVPHHSAV